MEYDVVVVGGGPVGGSTAAQIARAGHSVALLEEHREIGEPVQCAGIFTPRVLDLVEADAAVLNRVRGAQIYSPSGHRIDVDGGRTRAVVVDRHLFDREIVKKAIQSGADSYLGTLAVGAERQNGRMRLTAMRGDEELHFDAKIVVGADGVKSSVARWVGLPRAPRMLLGFEAEMENVECRPDFVKLFFGNEVAPGYFAWIIPTGEGGRVGLCVTEGQAYAHFKRLFERGPSAEFLRDAVPICYYTSGIPIGVLKRTSAANVMIVGDAACHVKATSGGGIYMGLMAAKECATTAVQALKEDDVSENSLRRYDDAWRQSIGKELKRDWVIHRTISKFTDTQYEALFDLIDNQKILDLVRDKGDIDYPSKIGLPLVKAEPRFLKYMGSALRSVLT